MGNKGSANRGSKKNKKGQSTTTGTPAATAADSHDTKEASGTAAAAATATATATATTAAPTQEAAGGNTEDQLRGSDSISKAQLNMSDAKPEEVGPDEGALGFASPRTEEKAASLIQHVARKHHAQMSALEDQQWKIFNDIDAQDEAEMLELAVFLQTLMDVVPGTEGGGTLARAQSFREEIEKDVEPEEDDTEDALHLDSITITDSPHFAIDGDIYNYTLSKGPVTPDLASKIVEVYRRGGRLSTKAVQKLLRVTYRHVKTVSNTTRVEVGERERLHIVGDLHGQLGDLMHILDHNGLPSPTNKYIFNGDFVDRGPNGVEVICILLAWHAAYPEHVILNRGNHEDHAICCVYGFQRECKEKYDELTFGMFVEVFRYMPLCTIVNSELFIIHGGLFHDESVSVDTLDDIDRTDYVPKPPVPYPDVCEGMNQEQKQQEYLKQLQRDALWSDPQPVHGMAPNPRGAGVVFGPDITQTFLDRNGLRMVIRSHECVPHGFDLPYYEEFSHLLATIFSASNYGGSGNDGAVMTFRVGAFDDSVEVPGGQLHYVVHTFHTSEAAKSLEATNQMSLFQLILKRRSALEEEFAAADDNNDGTVSKAVWADVMLRITNLQIRWLTTLSAIVPEEALREDRVEYSEWLRRFALRVEEGAATGRDSGNEVLMDAMYANRNKLEAIFHWFDTDGNGSISREEFHQGCETLNRTLDADQQLRNVDHVLELMDFDGNDNIDINEFFEVFRIMDAKDGSLDGVIELAGKH